MPNNTIQTTTNPACAAPIVQLRDTTPRTTAISITNSGDKAKATIIGGMYWAYAIPGKASADTVSTHFDVLIRISTFHLVCKQYPAPNRRLQLVTSLTSSIDSA